MKSILSLALLVGLGLSATSVQAWDTSPSCGSSTFPATGQITPATGTLTHTGAIVRDDGVLKAGGALRYQDNGDGTVTDLNTMLMWEKKSMDGSLHDVSKTFVWSSPATDTVWDWIDAHGAKYGLHRPMPGADPAHIQQRGDWHKIALALRESRIRAADATGGKAKVTKAAVASAR